MRCLNKQRKKEAVRNRNKVQSSPYCAVRFFKYNECSPLFCRYKMKTHTYSSRVTMSSSFEHVARDVFPKKFHPKKKSNLLNRVLMKNQMVAFDTCWNNMREKHSLDSAAESICGLKREQFTSYERFVIQEVKALKNGAKKRQLRVIKEAEGNTQLRMRSNVCVERELWLPKATEALLPSGSRLLAGLLTPSSGTNRKPIFGKRPFCFLLPCGERDYP